MRVISGKYKGKNLIGFDIDGTRPTMDRVKESLFGIIQNDVKNSIVLDLFAGSGSLGIEAISNGASEVYFVDNNIELINIIKKNTSGMNENIHIMKSDYKDALELIKNSNIKFDIIFLDPPYKLNLINDILEKIVEYNLLKENGIVVCEYENENIENNKLKLIKDKKYGSKKIKIFTL
ncbi:MAG: 16S rRNA (guanine(966)-N(2))-methyltransferase RsmD [Bacilli bacterium]|nr:16S rRNA (guanine(966)-N(2))-methyltransferase RsmD [Bacilli bacterium]